MVRTYALMYIVYFVTHYSVVSVFTPRRCMSLLRATFSIYCIVTMFLFIYVHQSSACSRIYYACQTGDFTVRQIFKYNPPPPPPPILLLNLIFIIVLVWSQAFKYVLGFQPTLEVQKVYVGCITVSANVFCLFVFN